MSNVISVCAACRIASPLNVLAAVAECRSCPRALQFMARIPDRVNNRKSSRTAFFRIIFAKYPPEAAVRCGPNPHRALAHVLLYFPFMRFSILCLFIGVSVLSYVHAAERAPLPVLPRDDAESFIERMEARGVIEPSHLGTKPWSRAQVGQALSIIQQKMQSDSEALNGAENAELARLRKVFSADLPAKHSEKPQSSFFSWADSTGSSIQVNLFLFGSAWVCDSSQPADYILTPGYGGRIWGRYRNRIGFFVQDRLAGDFSNRNRYQYNFNPNFGEFTITSPETRSDTIWTDRRNYERYTGWISGVWNGIEVLAGTDSPQWGPAGLCLSGEAPPFAQIRARAEMGRLQFTWFHGSLKSAADSTRNGSLVFLQKYLVGQRVDLALKNGLSLAYSATTVYGNRDPDFVYLIPVTPLFFAQHFNGDQDNTTMGFDATWAVRQGLKLYGELFLDDLLSPTDLDGAYWGNKWAFCLGAAVFPSWYDRMWEFRSDYTRIEPWVYTHRFGEITRYRHFGTILGSSLGPDSDRFRISAGLRPNAASSVLFRFENRRHGDGPNRGSSVLDSVPLIGSDKEFLAGKVESRQEFEIEAAYRFRVALMLRVALGREQAQDLAKSSAHRVSITADLDW